uniref:Actin like 9 n=2 Tax=Latimeria chalumnae TaxID=7897 RepID=H3A015_LATCH
KRTRAIVIDMGSGSCKIGLAGEPKPNSVVPSVLGYPSPNSLRAGEVPSDPFIGKDTRGHTDLVLVEPVVNGIIVDWEAAETLWKHIIFQELQISPEEHAILVSDPPLSPTTNREKMTEVLFENLSAPAMYVASQSVLTTYSYGNTSGLVMESGHSVTHVVPVHEGYNMPHASERIDLAGFNITSYLMELLQKSGRCFTEKGRYIVEDIKEKCCYVAVDIITEAKLQDTDYLVDYELPDGHIITLGKERFKCPEALFTPTVIDSQVPGIHTTIINSLEKIPEEVKHPMLKNILLGGGSTLFEGFYDRLHKELINYSPQENIPRIISVPERKYSVWIGGSILASLKSFQCMWVRSDDYKEHGPFIVHRMCY